MLKLTKVRNNGWLHDSGIYVAKFNFGYLVYKSEQAYQTPAADYVSFQTMKEVKAHISKVLSKGDVYDD